MKIQKSIQTALAAATILRSFAFRARVCASYFFLVPVLPRGVLVKMDIGHLLEEGILRYP